MRTLLVKALFVVAFMSLGTILSAQQSLDYSKTLRCDYLFSGTSDTAEIALSELRSLEGWAGRRVNMDKVHVRGNGQIKLSDPVTGKVLYAQSFSTLFQEWQNEEEATQLRKSFENVFLLPMPSGKANVTVTLFDVNGEVSAELTHAVDPTDILIRPAYSNAPYKYLHKGGTVEDCIDVAILAEGYSKKDMKTFYKDAQKVVDALFAHEPFGEMKDRFNIVAVGLESAQSGVSVPRENEWKNTAVLSNFDTFYSDRYLTTVHLKRMHDAIASVPYEHLIVLANTDVYGGGGIFNSYTLTTAHHDAFMPVVVHEFGHSFAGLADEYFYDDQYSQYYNDKVEPWEQNITTMVDFDSKWASLIKEGTPVPTTYTIEDQRKVYNASRVVRGKWAEAASGKKLSGEDVIIGTHEDWPEFKVGAYEGAGYMSKGAFRATPECRMKINEYPYFCPACQRAIRNIIEFYTVQQ